jgi:hypothetical protein
MLPSLDEPLSAKSDARWLAERVAGQPGFEVGYFGRTPLDVPKETTALEFYGRFAIRAVCGLPEIEAYLSREPATVMLVQERDLERLQASTSRDVRIERRLLIGDDGFAAVSSVAPAARVSALRGPSPPESTRMRLPRDLGHAVPTEGTGSCGDPPPRIARLP